MALPASCPRFLCAILIIFFWIVTNAQSQETNPPDVEALRTQLESLQAQMADLQARLDHLSMLPNSSQSAVSSSGGTDRQTQQSTKEEVAAELNQKVKHEV